MDVSTLNQFKFFLNYVDMPYATFGNIIGATSSLANVAQLNDTEKRNNVLSVEERHAKWFFLS